MAENIVSRIRQAEEEAASIISTAREGASGIIRDASATAEALLAESRRLGEAQASSLTAKTEAESTVEIEELRRLSSRRKERLMNAADQGCETAVSYVLEEVLRHYGRS
ncbi:MAG: hypothetical protein PHT33_06045 [bacterium]|nr:hypothetical protein [bacterium]